MNRTTAFLLLIQKDTAGGVVQLQIALDRPTFDTDGHALVTPAVATADEFESALNALQAELDETRVQGRRLLSPAGLSSHSVPSRVSNVARCPPARSQFGNRRSISSDVALAWSMASVIGSAA
jgi:hypothetical protein